VLPQQIRGKRFVDTLTKPKATGNRETKPADKTEIGDMSLESLPAARPPKRAEPEQRDCSRGLFD